jgi:ATP-binding cassette, subfamily G (WHITE), member 1
LIIAIVIMVVHISFAGVLVLQKDAQWWMHWIFEIDFMKHSNDGMIHAIFGYNRTKLECEEMYCHFRNPETLLKMIDAPKDPIKIFSIFPAIFLFIHILTFYNMNKRLKGTH